MTLQATLAGALADRYRIVRELGHGGMAIVYLAEDLRHHRQVAIKVLRPELARALGPERFLREIETTAGLHHPHILPLYESGRTGEGDESSLDDLLYYVMPLVEGESLRDRLDREKQLPLDEALQIAREVADALSYAHGRGIIHRDIKPANIMLESGHALVADFGIARAVRAAGGDRLTETGLAVGTPAYMSPEQAAGDRDVDGRSDLYALGCVLYEMLAGQPPFTGPTAESVVRQHLAATPPPITQLRPAVPSRVAGTLERALAKNPADRFNPVAQFSEALSSQTASTLPALPARRLWRLPAAIVALPIIAIAIALGLGVGRRDSSVVVSQTIRVTRDPGLEVDPALSPDGTRVAYAAGPPTRMQIMVRQVSGGRVVSLTSDTTRNHRWPRWSPDGTRVAYQTDDGIEAVPALGGQAQALVRLDSVAQESFLTTGFTLLNGFAWSPDGRSLAYIRYLDVSNLLIVPLDGGEAKVLAALPEQGAAWAGLHSPAWSPDGTRLAVVSDNPIFVFGGMYFGNEGSSTLWIFPVSGKPPTRVTNDANLNMSPVWSRDSRYLYWVSDRGGGRDVYRMRVSGDGTPAGDPVRLTTGADAQTITLSADGSRLAYASFRTRSNIWSLPIPRTGVASGDAARAVTTGAQTIETVEVSPDGRWLAFDSDLSGNFDIYTMPVHGGEPRQLTTDSAGDYGPTWSPDGRQLAFHSLRRGTRDVYTMNLDGSALMLRSGGPAHELDSDWSPDGRALVFEFLNWDLSMGHFTILPLDGGEPRELAEIGDFAHWSPAGDRIVYHATDGLRSVSPSGGPSRLIVPVSEQYGEPFYVTWSPDGRTMYYLSKGTRGSYIHATSPSGGGDRLLVRFEDPARQHTRYGFDTDGKTFYFTLGSHESDVWVAELGE